MKALMLLLACVMTAHATKVDVKFYGESLCPDCKDFTSRVLHKLYLSDIFPFINFRYIGWGNVAKVGDEYRCQHGPLECTMNTVLNCAQNQSSNQEQFFDFLYCIESDIGSKVEEQIPGCAAAAYLSLKPLESCYKGEKGRRLDKAAMLATSRLEPPHTYVPWVTVNDQPIFGTTDLLLYYICAAYKGVKPRACSQAPQTS